MKNFIFSILILTIFVFNFNSFGQETNNTGSLETGVKIGNLFINKGTGDLYIKFKDCLDTNIYKLEIDDQNWKVKFPKWGTMDDAVALNQFSLPRHYYTMSYYLKNYFKNNSKSFFSILKNQIKKGNVYYISRLGIPYQIDRKEGIYKIDGEGEIHIIKQDTSYLFSFKYIDVEKQFKNIQSELIQKNMFILNSTDFERLSCFSVDEQKEKGSLSFDTGSEYKISVIDLSKNQSYQDLYSSNSGYNFIEKKLMSKKRALYYINSMSESEIGLYYEKSKLEIDSLKKVTTKIFGQVSPTYSETDINKLKVDLEYKYKYLKDNGSLMYVTETAKVASDKLKKIETSEVYPGITFSPGDSKVFNNYIFKGGFENFNDSLVQILNLTEYQLDGYVDKNRFVLTSNFVDPLKRFNTYTAEKLNYKELIEFCQNQPNTILKLETLNNKLSDIENKINLAQTSISRYSFNLSEQKDASGSIITEIKVLKDCKNYDLNNQTEREGLKALVKDRNNKISEAVLILAGVLKDYILINTEIKGCQLKQDSPSGSALVDGLSKFADKASKLALQASLVATTTKATKLLDNSKKANDELSNYSKVLESYNKSN